jgi:hypothetical protein
MNDSEKRKRSKIVRRYLVARRECDIVGIAEAVWELYGDEAAEMVRHCISELEKLPMLCFTVLSKKAEIMLLKAVLKHLEVNYE